MSALITMAKMKNLIRVMLKPFGKIQVKIYGSSIGNSIFLAAQLVLCDELQTPLTQFDQAYSSTQLWLLTDRVSSACPTESESNGADSSFLLNLDVPPMNVISTLLSYRAENHTASTAFGIKVISGD